MLDKLSTSNLPISAREYIMLEFNVANEINRAKKRTRETKKQHARSPSFVPSAVRIDDEAFGEEVVEGDDSG